MLSNCVKLAILSLAAKAFEQAIDKIQPASTKMIVMVRVIAFDMIDDYREMIGQWKEYPLPVLKLAGNWRSFLQEPVNESEVQSLRKHERTD